MACFDVFQRSLLVFTPGDTTGKRGAIHDNPVIYSFFHCASIPLRFPLFDLADVGAEPAVKGFHDPAVGEILPAVVNPVNA
jgi:hypothetical protein